jgi:hypothetical protein
MLSYRYVLHLRQMGKEQIVRHTSRRPLRTGETLPVASNGRWIVREIVSDGRVSRDGIVYCEPADEQA